MTLVEWEKKTGIVTKEHLPSMRCTPCGLDIWGGIAWELWHLTDWRVHGVTGGTIWLVPRNETK